MATLAGLIKGFRHNVRNGYPSTLMFREGKVYLSVEPINSNGYVGICSKPSTKKTK